MHDEELILTEIDPPASTSTTVPPPSPAGTFYRVDSSRASFRELWRDARSPLVLIVWLTKLLRVKLPGSVNDPNVESLRPFVVDPADIPPEPGARLDFALRELRTEGFEPSAYLAIIDLFHGSRTYVALLSHRDGRAVGRITLRTEGTSQKPRSHFFTDYLSEFDDGTFLCSSSARSALRPPPGTRLNWNDAATPRQLWSAHKQALEGESRTGRRVVPVRNSSDLLVLVERHHATVRDYHLGRKLFAPMEASDREQAAMIAEKHGAADRGELRYPDVMAELHKLQTKRTNWISALIILAFSLVLFIGAGFAQKWESLWLLIPILFFHELGHYLAMRIFGYRNLRMFFIPFLGAAVSGQNYTAPGWKKVLVALAGPLPGIVVGGVLGGLGIYYEKPILINAALLALILNGFNLLPVLPLDGGRVMHTILFSRHHLLDVTFRVLAAAALAGLGALSGDKILLYFGIFMLVGIPAAYRLAKIATELRRAGVRAADLPADHVIPADVAAPIIERVQASFPRVTGPKMVAQHTLHVYETLATRPPGWLASITLGAVHAGSLLVAIVIAMVVVLAQHGNLGRFVNAAASMPTMRLDPTGIVAWDTPTAGAVAVATVPRSTIIATFDEPESARSTFDEVKSQPPANGRVVLFGHTVLLDLPATDDAARRTWVDRFEARTKQVFVQGDRMGGTFTVTCIARTKKDAEDVVAALNQGIGIGSSMHLVPPWHPDDRRTPAQVVRHDRARQTYAKLNAIWSSAWEDPRVTAIANTAAESSRRGEEAEAERLQGEQMKAYKVVRAEQLKNLLESSDPSLDRTLIERFMALEEADPEQRYQRITAELGPLMGQVEMAGAVPAPGADRYSAMFGFASNEGLLVTARSVSFTDVGHGAPAIVAWLRGLGCMDFRYQFAMGGLLDGLDLDEVEEE